MLSKRATLARTALCRAYSQTRQIRPLSATLGDTSIETFRKFALEPAIPALLPRGAFLHLPAIQKWFVNGVTLNGQYLSRYGSTIVPLEFSNDDRFSRTEQSLSFFLQCVNATSSHYYVRPNRYFSAYVPGARAVKRTAKSNNFFSAASVTLPTARIYLAQAAIANLPQGLKDDVPTPGIVLNAGKGDVYDSSIWLGEAPTFTPLHRDPNPNLFVQLAGTKRVRLFEPGIGRGIFAQVQEQIGGSSSAAMRGEEMMQGVEKAALEAAVWDDTSPPDRKAPVVEVELAAGDGLFIPKGWWHSVKGVGTGMIGSVNWWFR